MLASNLRSLHDPNSRKDYDMARRPQAGEDEWKDLPPGHRADWHPLQWEPRQQQPTLSDTQRGVHSDAQGQTLPLTLYSEVD